ncbi:MAG: hypothetical protein IJV31_04010 [Clostridia bacterium]|nr:hypothetical protein [Clostridia bacterium]
MTKKFDSKVIFVHFICFIVATLAAFFSGGTSIVYIGVAILCSYKIDFKKAKKFALCALIIGTLFVMFLFALGIIDQSVRYREDGFVRYSFGFNHPNVLGQFYFIICLLIIDCFYSKLNLKISIPLLIILLFIFIFTDSRTSFWCTILLFLVSFLLKKAKTLNKMFLFDFSPIFFMVLIISLSLLYGRNQLIYDVNNLLSGRISSIHRFLNDYPITFFGQEVFLRGSFDTIAYGGVGAVLDSSYGRLIIMYGIVPTLIFIIGYCFSLKTFRNLGGKGTYIALLIYSIYIIFEASACNFATNIFILSFSEALFNISKKNKSIFIKNKSVC